MIDQLLVETSCYFTSQEEALRYGAAMLYTQGLVSDDYANEIVEREMIYPTGIESYVNFSICHTDTHHSKGNGLCVLTLNNPIKFYNMADTKETLGVRVIFMLAATSPDGHMRLLQDIISLMSNKDSASRFIQANRNELTALLQENVRRS